MTSKAYEIQWGIYERDYWVAESPMASGAIYSFFDIVNGKVKSPDDWADTGAKGPNGLTQFETMRALRSQGKEVQLSIGGWTFSRNFSDACLTSASRATFVGSIIDVLKGSPGTFNGISLDWEYPSDQGSVNGGLAGNIARVGDGDRFILAVKLLREQLNANGYGSFVISSYLSADKDRLEGHLNLTELNKYLSEFHVQGYDFSDGNWGENIASHQCNLFPKPGVTKFSIDESVRYYLSKGVPAHKIHIGVAFYSRGFTNCEGFGKSASGGDNVNWSWERGTRDYKHIVQGGTGIGGKSVPKFPTAPIWDDDMRAHYFYDAASKTLITCDTVRSVLEKSNYVKQNGLGGLFAWDASGDLKDHNNSLSLFKAMNSNPVVVPPVVVPPVVVPPVVVPPVVVPPPAVPTNPPVVPLPPPTDPPIVIPPPVDDTFDPPKYNCTEDDPQCPDEPTTPPPVVPPPVVPPPVVPPPVVPPPVNPTPPVVPPTNPTITGSTGLAILLGGVLAGIGLSTAARFG